MSPNISCILILFNVSLALTWPLYCFYFRQTLTDVSVEAYYSVCEQVHYQEDCIVCGEIMKLHGS